MASPPTFSGSAVGEFPEEYVEDVVEYLAQSGRQDPGTCTMSTDDDRKQYDGAARSVFRQGLKGSARNWMNEVPREARSDWSRLTTEFIARFAVMDDSSGHQMIRYNEIEHLQQGQQSLPAYVSYCSELYRKCNAENRRHLAHRFLAGLNDERLRLQVHTLLLGSHPDLLLEKPDADFVDQKQALTSLFSTRNRRALQLAPRS